MKEEHKKIWAFFILIAIGIGAVIHPGIFYGDATPKQSNTSGLNNTFAQLCNPENKSVYLQVAYYVRDFDDLRTKEYHCGDQTEDTKELGCVVKPAYTDGNVTYTQSIPVYVKIVIR